jgi:hypothetical protein
MMSRLGETPGVQIRINLNVTRINTLTREIGGRRNPRRENPQYYESTHFLFVRKIEN